MCTKRWAIRVTPTQLFCRGEKKNILIFLTVLCNALNMHSVKSQIFLTNQKPGNRVQSFRFSISFSYWNPVFKKNVQFCAAGISTIFFRDKRICVFWENKWNSNPISVMYLKYSSQMKRPSYRGDRGYMGQILEKIFKLDF